MTNQRSDASATGGKILPRKRVIFSAEPVAVTLPGGERANQPNVRLFRDGNIVRAIDVVCPCGQTVRLHCEYQQTPADSAIIAQVDEQDATRS